MKRIRGIFAQIVEFANLLAAVRRAKKGKSDQPPVQRFLFRYEYELLQLQQELTTGCYRMQPYITFTIRDPKERQIAAPVFRDHVVAHAVYRIVYPLIDKMLIADTFGSRVDKGPARAVYRAQHFSRRFSHFLKLDVNHYFSSIDHAVLIALLERKFADRALIDLVRSILAAPVAYHSPGKGIALGHLLSQIFANLYLNDLDHTLKEQRKIRGYIRYVDDLLLFADSKEELHDHRDFIAEYLHEQLQLVLKSRATILAPIRCGVPFLGFLVFPHKIRLRNSTLRRARKKLNTCEQRFVEGALTAGQLQHCVNGLIEHLCIADSLRLRQKWLAQRPIDG